MAKKCDSCNKEIIKPKQHEIEMDMCEKCIWEQYGPEILQQAHEMGLLKKKGGKEN